jgi:hypothetical protein
MINNVIELTERQQALMLVAIKRVVHGLKVAGSPVSLAIELREIADRIEINLSLAAEEIAQAEIVRLVQADNQ